MNQNVEEIRERGETEAEHEARKEVRVTRIREVDDVQHEQSKEQRKQEEE